MYNRNVQLWIMFLIVFLAAPGHAGSGEFVNQEIDHLLEYVENAGCEFIRNSKSYNGAEARAHIQRKYNYFKGRIKTTEDFMAYAATKSTMSGKTYKVRCNGREMSCAEWLRIELERFRNR